MKTLNGKRVLITGAASGIGLECARAFARRGASLVISDINAAALEPVRQEFVGKGVQCFAHACNVASEQEVGALATLVERAYGPLDVLVNNAGIAWLGSFQETSVEQWRRILDVNVIGIVNCIRAFLPAMRGAGGERKIVNVASTAGVVPVPNLCAYTASKHAVIGLSEVLAVELHDTDVSVLVVCPGIINTEIIRTPNSTGPSISDAQIAKLRQYYVDEGCLPDVVAEGIVRSVLNDDIYLFVGPMAKPASILARISRRLTRKAVVRDAHRSGYLA